MKRTPLTYMLLAYGWGSMTRLQTVAEMPEFQRRAKAIMSDEGRDAVVQFIAANPQSGASLGGGLRKVRIPRDSGGKSGGFRAIFVFGGHHMPVFLITIFAKNERDNLTKAEQSAAVELSKRIVAMYGDRR